MLSLYFKNQRIVIRNLLCINLIISQIILINTVEAKVFVFNHDIPVSMDTIPESKLRSQIEILPVKIKEKALENLKKIEFPIADISSLNVDSSGAFFYACSIGTEKLSDERDELNIEEEENDFILAELTQSEVFTLHSKPGASRVVHLDMDGAIVIGKIWNGSSGVDTHDMLPYDEDGDTTTFNDSELKTIAETWKRIAEDYAPFDIDVTTEEPSSYGPNTGHILVSPKIDANGNAINSTGAAGLGYINKWGNDNFTFYQPALVFPEVLGNNANKIAFAASHELGHNLGLRHHGTSTIEYYSGHGNGNISWSPLMGNGFGVSVSQWSKGEYEDANNSNQDDISIIEGHLTERTDDHVNTLFGATALQRSSFINISSTNPVTDHNNTEPFNKGIIETQNDIDFFFIDVVDGTIDLKITPSWIDSFNGTSEQRSANLDIKATLYNETGGIVIQDDKINDTYAHINTIVSTGRYFLAIEGTSSENYSNYASIGQYFINGTVIPNGTPVANAGEDQVVKLASTITLDASLSIDDGTITFYSWSSNLDGKLGTGESLTISSLSEGTHTITLMVTDDSGLSSTDIVQVIVSSNNYEILSNENWLQNDSTFISQNHDHSTVSSLELVFVATIEIKYSVSSESCSVCDFLRIYKNNNLQVEIGGEKSGILIASAGDILKFEYKKDGSVSTGDDSATIILNVVPGDTTPPVLSSTTQTFITTVGTPLTLATVTANDGVDGSVNVTQTGSVDFNAVGIYTITYTATDLAGNIATLIHTYVINDIDDPNPPETGNWMEARNSSTITEENGNVRSSADGSNTFGMTKELTNLNVGQEYTLNYSFKTGNSIRSFGRVSKDSQGVDYSNSMFLNANTDQESTYTFIATQSTMYVVFLSVTNNAYIEVEYAYLDGEE